MIELQRRVDLKRNHSVFAEDGCPAKPLQLVRILQSRKPDEFKKDIVQKETEILDRATPAEVLDLFADVKDAFTILRDATYQCCSLHNMDFTKIAEKHNKYISSGYMALFISSLLTVRTISVAYVRASTPAVIASRSMTGRIMCRYVRMARRGVRMATFTAAPCSIPGTIRFFD